MNVLLKMTVLVAIFCSTHSFASYCVTRSAFNCGCTSGSSSQYGARGAIGQTCIGAAAGPSHVCHIGFWFENQLSVWMKQPASVGSFDFQLFQNYPNPNPATIIEYTLASACRVRLTIFDSLGRCVRRIVDARQQAGFHRTEWRGTDEHDLPVATGSFLCRLQAGDFSEVIRLTLLR